MNTINRIALFTLFLLFSCANKQEEKKQNPAEAIRLHDMQSQKIHILQLTDDLYRDEIKVTCNLNKSQTDSLIIQDSRGIDSIIALSPYFIQVSYRKRCGSGCAIRYSKIFGISNSKITCALTFKSFYRHDIDEMYYERGVDSVNEHARYTVKIEVVPKKGNFGMVLTESYYEVSALDPKQNQDWIYRDTLFFDDKNLVFSNNKNILDGQYTVITNTNVGIDEYKVKALSLGFSGLQLKRQTLVFINDGLVKENGWYELSEDFEQNKVLIQ